MKKASLIMGVILLISSASFAQSQMDSIQQLQRQLLNLETVNSRLLKQVIVSNSNISKLEQRLSATIDSLNAVKKELTHTNINLDKFASNLGSQVDKLSAKTNYDMSNLDSKIGRNTQYLIFAVILLAILSAALFIWLRNKLNNEKAALTETFKNSIDALRREMAKPEKQFFGLDEPQIPVTNIDQIKPDEIDHVLALKVADEIIRIQKNLSNIDPETKGLKQIQFALERIQDYFTEYGYEMVELLYKPYDPGMNIMAKFKPDNALARGEQLITRIIKPQINYKGLIIQPAEVEVSVGE